MKTIIATIQTADITLETDDDGMELVEFTADMDIDCDGAGGNPHHDPCFQPDTRLHLHGAALHAETVPYMVVPPVILAKTRGKVLGSLCEVTNMQNGKMAYAVVGDSGPTRKVGEGSPALAELIGLDGNPNHGGTSDFIIRYRIYVGRAAVIAGVAYDLQSA